MFSPVVTLFSLFPHCVCKARTFLKQLNPSVLAPTSTAVVKHSGNEGFGVSLALWQSWHLLSSSWASPAAGPVLPSPCLAVFLQASVLWLLLSELSGSQPGVISGSAARFLFQGLMKRSSGTLHLTHCFLCHPTLGSTALPMTSLGSSWGEESKRRQAESLTPGFISSCSEKWGFFCFFFSCQQPPSCNSFSLGGDLIVTELTPFAHTLATSRARLKRHNRDHSVVSQNCWMPSNHTHHQRPNAPVASAQLQTTQGLCCTQWQTVRHGSHPPSKPFCFFVCLFVCHRTWDGFSCHLPAPSVGAAPHKREHATHFTSFPCNFCLSAARKEMAAWCRQD